MVAAGISSKGVGKLIFCVGTVNSFAYKQGLDYYKEDIENYGSHLYFQQDGAKCHTCPSSMAKLNPLFENKLDFWPPNSPDLSPIEPLWAIVKSKLHQSKYSSMDEMKKNLIRIWESIPATLCQKLCDSFKKRLELCKKFNGRRLDRELLKKLRKSEKVNHIWFPAYYDEEFDPERIIYNDKIVHKLGKKQIAKLNKELVLIKREFRERIRNAKNTRKLSSLRNTSYSRFLTINAAPERLEAERKTKIEEKEELIKWIKLASAQEYIDSLNFEVKKKLINFNLTREPWDSESTHLTVNNVDDPNGIEEEQESISEENEIQEEEDEESDDDQQ